MKPGEIVTFRRNQGRTLTGTIVAIVPAGEPPFKPSSRRSLELMRTQFNCSRVAHGETRTRDHVTYLISCQGEADRAPWLFWPRACHVKPAPPGSSPSNPGTVAVLHRGERVSWQNRAGETLFGNIIEAVKPGALPFPKPQDREFFRMRFGIRTREIPNKPRAKASYLIYGDGLAFLIDADKLKRAYLKGAKRPAKDFVTFSN